MDFLNIIAWATAVLTTVHLGISIWAINDMPSWQINYTKVRWTFTIGVLLIVVSVLWILYG